MGINANWPRWITSSVNTHFSGYATADLVMHAFGQIRATREEPNFFEIVIDGPNIEEVSNNYFRVTVEIFVLLQTTRSETDLYLSQKTVGTLISAFTKNIAILKYSDGDAHLECLNLLGELKVSNLGEVSPEVKVQQISVRAAYKMFLTGDD